MPSHMYFSSVYVTHRICRYFILCIYTHGCRRNGNYCIIVTLSVVYILQLCIEVGAVQSTSWHGCTWWGARVYVVGCTGVRGGCTGVRGEAHGVRGGAHECTWWGARVYVVGRTVYVVGRTGVRGEAHGCMW